MSQFRCLIGIPKWLGGGHALLRAIPGCGGMKFNATPFASLGILLQGGQAKFLSLHITIYNPTKSYVTLFDTM